MSRTKNRKGEKRPAKAVTPASLSIPTYFPRGFVDEMGRHLHGVNDVQLSLNLLTSHLHALIESGQPFEAEREGQQVCALLRILNRSFSARVSEARGALGLPIG